MTGGFLSDKPVELLRLAMAKGLNAPLSSSAGRLFDAVASLIFQDTQTQSFEGAFAMRLEAAARQAGDRKMPALPPAKETAGPIEPAEMLLELARYVLAGEQPGQLAMAFHHWLASAFAVPARALVSKGQARAVALSGGCFQNALLLELVVQALGDVPVLIHTKVPANDGGLALGQALIAASGFGRNR